MRAEGMPRENPGCAFALVAAVFGLVVGLMLFGGGAPAAPSSTPTPAPAVTR